MKADQVDAAAEACSGSPSSSNRLLLALCQHACASTTTTASGDNQGPSATTGSGSTGGGSGPGGFAPVRLQPASFVALARLLRASLDQAASDREFLQARNCLVTAGLFAVDGGNYVSWLREQDGSQQGKSGGGGGGNNIPAVMADNELVSAARKLDEASAAAAAAAAAAAPAADVPGGEGAGDADEEAAGYLLLRELRRHPVWAAIELWEVSMSDSVVMAMEGGGARAERWLTRDTLDAMRERFGEDAASRQLDVKLGQLAFLGHSMLACGVPPSEVRSLVRKCSSLAMEIPSRDLEALTATLNTFVMGPRPAAAAAAAAPGHPRSRSVSSVGGDNEPAPAAAAAGGGGEELGDLPPEAVIELGGEEGGDGDGGGGSSGDGDGDSNYDSDDASAASSSSSSSYTSESGLSSRDGVVEQ